MIQTINLVVYHALALFGGLGDDINSEGGVVALQEALRNFRPLCERVSGSDAGYRKFGDSFGPAVQCMNDNIDRARRLARDHSEIPETTEDLKTIMDRFWLAHNESVTCFDDVLEGIAMCGDEKVGALKSMYKKSMQNTIDLMFKNNGQLLIEVPSPEFHSCVEQIETEIKQCELPDFIRERPFFQDGEEMCSELKRSKQCIYELVSTCSTTIIKDIFNAIFEPVAETVNCKLIEESETTETNIEILCNVTSVQ